MLDNDKLYAVELEYFIDDKQHTITLGRLWGFLGYQLVDVIKDALEQNKDLSVTNIYEVCENLETTMMESVRPLDYHELKQLLIELGVDNDN